MQVLVHKYNLLIGDRQSSTLWINKKALLCSCPFKKFKEKNILTSCFPSFCPPLLVVPLITCETSRPGMEITKDIAVLSVQGMDDVSQQACPPQPTLEKRSVAFQLHSVMLSNILNHNLAITINIALKDCLMKEIMQRTSNIMAPSSLPPTYLEKLSTATEGGRTVSASSKQ